MNKHVAKTVRLLFLTGATSIVCSVCMWCTCHLMRFCCLCPLYNINSGLGLKRFTIDNDSYFQMIIIAVICVLYVHIQKAELNVGVSIHSNGPVVVGIVGIGSRIKWGRYLTWIPGQIITVHCNKAGMVRCVVHQGIIIYLTCIKVICLLYNNNNKYSDFLKFHAKISCKLKLGLGGRGGGHVSTALRKNPLDYFWVPSLVPAYQAWHMFGWKHLDVLVVSSTGDLQNQDDGSIIIMLSRVWSCVADLSWDKF